LVARAILSARKGRKKSIRGRSRSSRQGRIARGENEPIVNLRRTGNRKRLVNKIVAIVQRGCGRKRENTGSPGRVRVEMGGQVLEGGKDKKTGQDGPGRETNQQTKAGDLPSRKRKNYR